MAEMKAIVLIIGLTILSGFADSQGFIHASNIWEDRKVVWAEAAKSALGFGSGILLYWIALKHLKEIQVVTPEIHTLIWFGVTMVGVASLSGRFMQWHIVDQLVAVGVVCGIVWLLVRNGG